MQLTLPIALSVLLAGLSGCVAVPQIPSLNCPVAKTNVLTYGIKNKKTIFQVKEKITVTRGNALAFKLNPQNSGGTLVNFENAEVTIVGKDNDPKNAWITEISGNYADDGDVLGICVPAFLDPEPVYEYEVHVEGLGTLDPRVIVEL